MPENHENSNAQTDHTYQSNRESGVKHNKPELERTMRSRVRKKRV